MVEARGAWRGKSIGCTPWLHAHRVAWTQPASRCFRSPPPPPSPSHEGDPPPHHSVLHMNAHPPHSLTCTTSWRTPSSTSRWRTTCTASRPSECVRQTGSTCAAMRVCMCVCTAAWPWRNHAAASGVRSASACICPHAPTRVHVAMWVHLRAKAGLPRGGPRGGSKALPLWRRQQQGTQRHTAIPVHLHPPAHTDSARPATRTRAYTYTHTRWRPSPPSLPPLRSPPPPQLLPEVPHPGPVVQAAVHHAGPQRHRVHLHHGGNQVPLLRWVHREGWGEGLGVNVEPIL